MCGTNINSKVCRSIAVEMKVELLFRKNQLGQRNKQAITSEIYAQLVSRLDQIDMQRCTRTGTRPISNTLVS